MKIFHFGFILFLALLFIGCGGDSDSNSSSTNCTPEAKPLPTAKGNVKYGGVFRYNEESYFRDLFPHNVRGTIAHRIVNNMYEGLTILTQDRLQPVPGLAESWTVSEDGMNYTFKIRKGVSYHPDKCFENCKPRTVTAHDVKYVFDLLCDSREPNNAGFWVFEDKVMGAPEYNEATRSGNAPEGGVEGIKVLDDYTLEMNLVVPFPDFLKILAQPFCYVFPKEAYEEYGSAGLRRHAVGTGPFYLRKIVENEAVLMRRNDNYWGSDNSGNALPYLEGIKVSFIKEQKSTLLAFKKGNLDMVYRIAQEMVPEVLDEKQELTEEYKNFVLQKEPTLALQYYGFQHQTKPYNNVKLRQALCYAIDRKKIVDFVVRGMGSPANGGVVPVAMKKYTEYDPTKIKGFKFDPNKARKLLSEAGYPDGKGLDKITLQINVGGGKNTQIAEAIQKQIQETLNLEVEILQMQFAQHYETIESAKTNFFRAGWIADYTSPENFLKLFYGPMAPESLDEKTYMNTVRYKNKEYDQIFEKAMATQDDNLRASLYARAENLLVRDAVVLPIFFDVDMRLIQKKVANFPQNGMEYRTFREVYFSEEK